MNTKAASKMFKAANARPAKVQPVPEVSYKDNCNVSAPNSCIISANATFGSLLPDA